MKRLVIFLIASIISLFGYTQDSVLTINDLYIDFAIPDMSAFNILGETPKNIAKPGNIKDFSAEILNISGGGMNITPGIALELNPYLIFNSRKEVKNQIGQYRRSKIRGLQLTLGTLQDSSGSKLAYGIKWTLFDKADPLIDVEFQNEIVALQQQYLNELPNSAVIRQNLQDSVNAFRDNLIYKYHNNIDIPTFQLDSYFLLPKDDDYVQESYSLKLKNIKEYINKSLTLNKLTVSEKKELDKLINEYYQIIQRIEIHKNRAETLQFDYQMKLKLNNYRKENWNRSALHLGVGHLLNSVDYTWGNIKSDKISFYANYKHPVYNHKTDKFGIGFIWQIIGNRYFSADSLDNKILLNIGNRIIIGQDAFRISFENMYTFIEKEKVENRNIFRSTLGFEFQISEGTWLEFAFGLDNEFHEIKNSSNVISLMNFKYTIGKERRFN